MTTKRGRRHLEKLAANQSAEVKGTDASPRQRAPECTGTAGTGGQTLAGGQARQTPRAPRVLRLKAALGTHSPDEDLARTIEKLASSYLPSGEEHASLIRAFENIGQHDLAHAWTRRWLCLRPWDPKVVDRFIVTASMSPSTETLVSAVVRATFDPSWASTCSSPLYVVDSA